MKKVLLIVIVFVAIVLIAMPLLRQYTKKASPQNEVIYSQSGTKITLAYSRPYVKDRLIFGTEEDGALIPWGKKWRTGANEATEIEFSQPIVIDDQKVPAGRYSLYTIPNPESWTVAINQSTNYWGINLFGETFDETKDIARGDALVISNPAESQEQLTISFEAGDSITVLMNIQWSTETAVLPIRLSVEN